MAMPFSPRLTLRPSWFHAHIPATFRGLRLLSRYEQDIAKTVALKMHHRVEIRGQCFAVARFQLLDEILHVLAHKLLCGRRLPVFTAGSRVLAMLLVAPLLAVKAAPLLLLLL